MKFGMLYVKPYVRLSKVGDNDYSLILGCDYVILFISQGVVKGFKKRGKKTMWPKY